jgi:sodium/potassium/calcium exchanger 6
MTIPLVDYEAENHNWNKFLNMMNCLTGPLFIVFAIKGKKNLKNFVEINDSKMYFIVAFLKLFGVIPIWSIAIVVSVVLTLFIMYSTKWDERPKHHWVFFCYR